MGGAKKLVLAEVGRGGSVAVLEVDPVEHADVVLASVAKRGLAVARGLGAHVKRKAPAILRLVHELRHGAVLSRQQASANQRHAGLVELGRAHFHSEALGKPGDEVLLIVGADLDGVAHFGRIGRVRDRRAPRDQHVVWSGLRYRALGPPLPAGLLARSGSAGVLTRTGARPD